jgi:predicted nucleic acid-binding protein
LQSWRTAGPFGQFLGLACTNFLQSRRIHESFKPPTPIASALEQVDAWLQSPSLVLLTEAEQHWSELRALLATCQLTGGRIHDARIAALCLQHGVRELSSADRDFGRFPNLRVVNPLVD